MKLVVVCGIWLANGMRIFLDSRCAWNRRRRISVDVPEASTAQVVKEKFFEQYCHTFDLSYPLYPDLIELRLCVAPNFDCEITPRSVLAIVDHMDGVRYKSRKQEQIKIS